MVYFLKNKFNKNKENILLAVAGGIMFASAIWSLLLPAIETSSNIIFVIIGFVLGALFLFMINKWDSSFSKMFLAVTFHNIPEGMAVGVGLASLLTSSLSFSQTFLLSMGIALQNIPEGAIISMPLREKGMSKTKSFFMGFLSGIVEPIFSILTLLLVSFVVPLLPFLLSFAAGAMIYVVVDELIPKSYSTYSAFYFTFGFLIMMFLDVIFS